MTLTQKRNNDTAIAFRVHELLSDGQSVEVGDYLSVTLPASVTMAARGEWNQPTTERVEERHLAEAKLLFETPMDELEEPLMPVDDGSCDPLYGSRMDDADLGRN